MTQAQAAAEGVMMATILGGDPVGWVRGSSRYEQILVLYEM